MISITLTSDRLCVYGHSFSVWLYILKFRNDLAEENMYLLNECHFLFH